MERFVYADNAATTKITQPVLDAMMPYLTEEYGNPSSLYRFANRAKRALEQGVSLTDESALTALAVDVMLEHWETAVSEAELTGEAEAEIQMQWTDGFWMPDEDALVAVVTEAFGN